MNSQPVRYRLVRLLLPLALFILGCPPPEPPPALSRLTLSVVGQAFYLAPGSDGSLLVQVWDNELSQPAAEARVQVLLNTPGGATEQVYAGETDGNGLLLAQFDVPELIDNPEQILTIVAQTDEDSIQYAEEVYVGRVYNVLVSTDKPVYQPGQVIHVRGLALDTLALEAAQAQPLILTVDDPQGNRLMRQAVTTSRWGIAAADFVLDSQAPSGDYIITAEMGPVSSSRSVEVKPYNLPRFKINFSPDRTFYLPGETAQGTVDAHYFFGKPVAGGDVRIEGFVTDVERQPIFELTGQTDGTGIYTYTFQVPDYFVGQLENNSAELDLEITVTDTADHAERISQSVTVAEQPLLVEAVPESGFLRPGVENLVYVQVSYPDGREVQADLTVAADGITQTVQTDEFGLATVPITPPSNQDVTLDVQASALTEGGEPGPTVQTRVRLGATGGDNAVLLRPERPEYRIGETLNVDIYVAGQAQTAYLDVVKGQQTFGLAALPIENGVAQAAIDLDGSLLGTLELHAYVITGSGEIARDRRLVLVNPAPAQVEVTADREVYRPGDTAALDVQVSRAGEPMAGALGVSIVDESVFSVGAQDPGFARTYFLLERELAEPRYEIHDFTPLQAEDPSPYDQKQSPIRSTAALGDGGTEGPVASGLPSAAPPPAAGADGRGLRATSQQLALFGFFAQELARHDVDAAQRVAADRADAVAAQDRAAIAWGWGSRAALALPLLGFAFYDGSRRRRNAAIALLLLGLTTFFWGACASASVAPAGEQAAESAAEPLDETTATRGQTQETRLRQFFPETLFWMPEVETDTEGRARIQVPIADSITTWRVSIVASDAQGNLGSAESSLRVFQDFFVEPDLPRFLTVGDEIGVPVSIFNYLDEAQTVQLAVEADDWFEFVGEPQLTVEVGPNEVSAAYIPIRVTGFGLHALQVTATGSAMSDAVRREVEVLPDGKPEQTIVNGKVGEATQVALAIPEAAIPGTARVVVKLYPGVVSQIVEGLEGLLQQPYGCFEQTSSITYPNVLVLDYLETTGQISPQVRLQAEQYINLGYQRLLTFETDVPGGFSLFGDPPPWTMLTAYGLMEFTDMGGVSYVDPALIERTANFLFSQQQDDHWVAEENASGSGGARPSAADLRATAYIVWALADAGYARSEPVQRAIGYLKTTLASIEQEMADTGGSANSPVPTPEGQTSPDPYALAMIANALVAASATDADAQALLNSLVAQATQEGELVHWRADGPTYMGGYGHVADIETTAMIAIALMRSGQHPDIAQGALDYLITQRDAYGSFYTTQATILTLKALLLGAQQAGETGAATVTLTLNGGRTQSVTIDESNADVVQQVVFDDIGPGEQIIDLAISGDRAVQYQVIADYYQPWSRVETDAPERQQEMRVDVFYDRTELAINDIVNVTAMVELLAPGTAGTVLVDLGLPPGFSPLTEDLDALVEQDVIDRYELTGRQILLYLTDVSSGQVYQFDYRLRAQYPIRAQTPSSQAYDYYTPARQDVSPPQRIIVTLGTP